MNGKSPQSPQFSKHSRFFALLVLLCLSGLILVLNAATFASALQSNIAWVNLNTYLRNETTFTNNLEKSLVLFSQAVNNNDENQSAWFGLGKSYTLKGEVDSAITIWRKSEINPTTLIESGIAARSKGDLDAALTHFRAVNALDDVDSQKGHLLAGTICQQTFATQHLLNGSNTQYCSNYLANNGNNLIVNGDFSARALYGWAGEHFFTGKNAARLQIEDLDESRDSVVSLMGQDTSSHYGLYQRMTLVPGTTVRFSGRFKLSGEENLTARLLYISWQSEDGTPHGNHGEQRSGQMEWTEFERTFHVPESMKSNINFYPVNFSGEGTIWFDDIQLEIAPD